MFDTILKTRRRSLLFVLLNGLLLSSFPALAQDDLSQVCGEAPVVTDESLKAYVEAKGGVFSRRIADASVKANIEQTAQDVFSKYPNADRVRVSEKLLNTFCYAVFGSTDLSTKEKIDYWFKVKSDFEKVSVDRLGKITDQNEYFVTEVSSAKRSHDGKSVIISASLRSVTNKSFHLSYLKDSGLATDSEGNVYIITHTSGVGKSQQCVGNSFIKISDYTIITPNSTQTVIFVFGGRQTGTGDISFSTNFCFFAEGKHGIITVGFHNVLSKL